MRYRTELSDKVLNGRPIVLENVSPILSMAEEKTIKRGIEIQLYNVFVRYTKK